MRKIKFRAKTKDSKNSKFEYSEEIGGLVQFFLKFNGDWYETDTLGQYIGRKDCNGKEIYEEDIVKYNNRLWIVKWDGEQARFTYDSIHSNVFGTMEDAKELEVIGNIYENPELWR